MLLGRKIILTLLVVFAVAPAEATPKLGKYICVSDFSFRIGPRSDGTIIAEKVDLPPEKQKFFVTIEKSFGHLSDCFTVKQAELLKNTNQRSQRVSRCSK